MLSGEPTDGKLKKLNSVYTFRENAFPFSIGYPISNAYPTTDDLLSSRLNGTPFKNNSESS